MQLQKIEDSGQWYTDKVQRHVGSSNPSKCR